MGNDVADNSDKVAPDRGQAARRKPGIVGNVRALTRLVQQRERRWNGRGGGARWLPLVIFSGCFVLIVLAVLDAPVGAYRKQWPDGLMAFSRAITDIGESFWYLVPSGAFIVVAMLFDWRRFSRRTRWLMANWFALCGYVFATIAASGLIATLLKRIIGRARPKHFEEQGFLAFDNFATDASFASFPSGHATTVGALMALTGLLFPGLRGPALVLAVALGSTRIVVGAHYPSDVIAGLTLGMWFAYCMALVFAGRGFIFTSGAGFLPTVHPSFNRFLAATPLRFLTNVSFLQRVRSKSP